MMFSERAVLLVNLAECQDELNAEVERLNMLYQAHTISANAALDKLRAAIDRRDALKLCRTYLSERK